MLVWPRHRPWGPRTCGLFQGWLLRWLSWVVSLGWPSLEPCIQTAAGTTPEERWLGRSPPDSTGEAHWSLSQKGVLERGPGLLTCCPHWGLGGGHMLRTGSDGRSARLRAWDGQSDVWLERRGLRERACVHARGARACMLLKHRASEARRSSVEVGVWEPLVQSSYALPLRTLRPPSVEAPAPGPPQSCLLPGWFFP